MGELQRKERDAACALRQDEIARRYPGKRVPRRERGTGQGGCLNRAVALWRFDHGFLAELHLLGHHAIDGTAQRRAAMLVAHRPAQPVRHDDRADEIARLGSCHARAARRNDPCPRDCRQEEDAQRLSKKLHVPGSISVLP